MKPETVQTELSSESGHFRRTRIRRIVRESLLGPIRIAISAASNFEVANNLYATGPANL